MRTLWIFVSFGLIFAVIPSAIGIGMDIQTLSKVSSTVSSVSSSVSSWLSSMMMTAAASGKREITDRYRHNYYINPVIKSNSTIKKRNIGLMEMFPDSYRVKFMLYTKKNKLSKEVLTVANASQSGMFDRTRETKMIFHDYNQSASDPMLIKLKNVYLNQNSFNVIMVDWETARTLSYSVSSKASELVGAMSGTFLIALNVDLKKVHAIGFGLGAHCAGVMGQDLGQIRRITGLDPSLPLFRMVDDSRKLDKADADFVDIIHTDGGNNFMHATHLGIGTPIGHVDVYANGGIFQPGCPTGHLPSYDELYCSHFRAVLLFLESAENPESIVACSCPSWTEFKNSKCDCKHKMIYAGDACPEKARGKFYLNTKAEKPYGMGRIGALPKPIPPFSPFSIFKMN